VSAVDPVRRAKAMRWRGQTALIALILATRCWSAQSARVLSAIPVSESEAMTSNLSPDGTTMAYITESSLLLVRDLKTQKAKELGLFTMPDSPVVAPDNSAVYLAAKDMRNPLAPQSLLFRVSIDNGEKKVVMTQITWFDLSPDGKQLLLRRDAPDTTILISGSDGQDPRNLIGPGTFKYRSAVWDRSGLVRILEWNDGNSPWKAWALNPRTGERLKATVYEPGFHVEQISKPGDFPAWGRVCRYGTTRYGTIGVVERLTPENEHYVRVLKATDDGTLLA